MNSRYIIIYILFYNCYRYFTILAISLKSNLVSKVRQKIILINWRYISLKNNNFSSIS